MQTAMALAGFDWAEADGLRKVLSKKSREQIEDYRKNLRRGAGGGAFRRRSSVPCGTCSLPLPGIPSASPTRRPTPGELQGRLAQGALPGGIHAAVIANGGGYYTARAYLSEAERLGLRILGPM